MRERFAALLDLSSAPELGATTSLTTAAGTWYFLSSAPEIGATTLHGRFGRLRRTLSSAPEIGATTFAGQSGRVLVVLSSAPEIGATTFSNMQRLVADDLFHLVVRSFRSRHPRSRRECAR